MCFSSMCCLRVVCGLFSDRFGQKLHLRGVGDGLGGGLLVGVEVLIGEGWSSSALLEGKESSAKMPNLLLSLNLIQASALSSESMVLPDPEIIKLGL